MIYKGYIPEPIKIDEDYIFGAYTKVPKVLIRPDSDWRGILPVEENQSPKFETFACVSETITSAIEAIERARFGTVSNYSARFLAAVSGTKDGGNSPQTVAEFARKVGVVGEERYPTIGATTFEDFYKKIPPGLYGEAKKYLENKRFFHEYVPTTPDALLDALKFSPIGVSVYAWPEPVNGRYLKPGGVRDTHLTLMVHAKRGDYFTIFDSYPPFIKILPWDYKFEVAKRFHVDAVTSKPGWFNRLLTALF